MVQALCNAQSNLMDRITSDIRTYGDEKTFQAVWRQVSPESVELVDYLTSDASQSAQDDVRDIVHAMPAWQILKVLQTQIKPQ